MRAFEDDHFRIEAVQDGLFRLTEKTVVYGLRVNCWIVEGRDATLVIDTGWGMVDWPMAQLFPAQDKPYWLALTHTHCDHMSQTHKFSERRYGHPLANAVVSAPDATNTHAQPWTGMLDIVEPGYEHLNFDQKAYGHSFEPAPLTHVIGEGDTIDLGGGVVLEAIHTPGHSVDSLSFLDRKCGWIFAGDVLIAGYIVDVIEGSDKRTILETHQKMLGLDFQWVYGGHQEPLTRQQAVVVTEKYAARKAREGIAL